VLGYDGTTLCTRDFVKTYMDMPLLIPAFQSALSADLLLAISTFAATPSIRSQS
jgi:hypothetical protein